MEFIKEDFMLQNEYGKILYEKYAKDMPIYDFHCHLTARDIYENKKFKNITHLWLYADHYKWRVMRAMGISEDLITGSADDYDKFLAWAKTVPNLIGNPLYHWTHLELKRYFGIDEVLNEKSAKKIYDRANELLATDDFTPRKLIEKSNVWAICTTDDPIDDLKYHKLLSDEGYEVLVKPAFRPEALMSIEKDSFLDYVKKLFEITNKTELNFKSIKEALVDRMDYFNEVGACASDHSLNYMPYERASEEEIDEILKKKENNEVLSNVELDKFKTEILIFLANEYNKRDWTMELHIGVIRNNSKKKFESLGADVGNDSINDFNYAENLANIFSDMEEGGLPRTILFSLNPKDLYVLSTIGGCFNEEGDFAKVQLGTSWWYLDHKEGMIEQMKIFSLTSVISKFIGMLTDSRSFVSYTRHEYFRRILCNLIGEYVEKGEYPWDEEFLGSVIRDISFNNARKFIKIER